MIIKVVFNFSQKPYCLCTCHIVTHFHGPGRMGHENQKLNPLKVRDNVFLFCISQKWPAINSSLLSKIHIFDQ